MEKVDVVKTMELATNWAKGLDKLREEHPRVVKKVADELFKWYFISDEMREITRRLEEQEGETAHILIGLAGPIWGGNTGMALYLLAYELLRRKQRRPQLRSVKIALTYKLYKHFHYGSLVKLYDDGRVEYKSRNCIEGYGFTIHNGREVNNNEY
ncbi:MAG: hypothetical protein H0Z19_11270 [Archaeoglobus sp.]|uniref:hypothetical protein n=1 Tax=Archaeoglobus sp. TaxID=1872626 RepID=UPI001D476321|nr:hypothetical protein [Archaeoglobus sp.]MBO8181027.1 hypothetical protein [Archaeoglobus sp.]